MYNHVNLDFNLVQGKWRGGQQAHLLVQRSGDQCTSVQWTESLALMLR